MANVTRMQRPQHERSGFVNYINPHISYRTRLRDKKYTDDILLPELKSRQDDKRIIPSSPNPVITDTTPSANRDEERPDCKLEMATSLPRSLRSNSTTREQVSSPPAGLSRTTTRRPNMDGDALVLSRIQTARSQHNTTVGFVRSKRGIKKRRTSDMPSMGTAKSCPALLSDPEEYVVEFDGPNDKLHPQFGHPPRRWRYHWS